jgi:uncharacterized membrane protein
MSRRTARIILAVIGLAALVALALVRDTSETILGWHHPPMLFTVAVVLGILFGLGFAIYGVNRLIIKAFEEDE